MDPREFIRTKRGGGEHPPGEIGAFLEAYRRGDVHDYQVSAWLMAAFLRDLSARETDDLTSALLHSGRVFDWTSLGRPSADKHSTGGVGDKISLMLAPLVAACGVLVPMVSGRGLGHTGGTLDKLEAIPGFRTTLPPDALHAQIERIGVAMVGQGPDLAPVDGMLYALRDVTSTVEFEPFIVSSIVSKKIAEGARALVYDVKCGNGAFMKSTAAAHSLARRLVETSRRLGASAVALVTDMNWPLGGAVGNSLEVREACETLRGGGPPDTRALTLDLASEMIGLAGGAPTVAGARARAERALDSGAAWEKWLELIRAQGGDPRAVEAADGLDTAPVVAPVTAERDGVLSACDCFGIGELVVSLGGGRRAKEDGIDPRVGIVVAANPGMRVQRGDVLATLHMARADEAAQRRARACFTIDPSGTASEATIPGRVIERVG